MWLPDDVSRSVLAYCTPSDRLRTRATCSSMRRVVFECEVESKNTVMAVQMLLVAHLESALRAHVIETTPCRTEAMWDNELVITAILMACDPQRLARRMNETQREALIREPSGVHAVFATTLDLVERNVCGATAATRQAEALTIGASHFQAVITHIYELQREKSETSNKFPHHSVARELVLAACADIRRNAESALIQRAKEEDRDHVPPTRERKRARADMSTHTRPPKSLLVRRLQ